MSREELLRLEVSELTEMLRADDCFIPLRQLLLEAGLPLDEVRLVRRSAEAAATDWPALNAAPAYDQ